MAENGLDVSGAREYTPDGGLENLGPRIQQIPDGGQGKKLAVFNMVTLLAVLIGNFNLD